VTGAGGKAVGIALEPALRRPQFTVLLFLAILRHDERRLQGNDLAVARRYYQGRH